MPEADRPRRCEHCPSERLPHQHGTFLRWVFTVGEALRLPVHRFLCPDCRKTMSLLPVFVEPHHQSAVDVKEAALRDAADGCSLPEIVEASGAYAGGGYSSMTASMHDEQIAAARYALIAPVVSRQTPMAPGELAQWLRETAARQYELPGSRRQTVSVRTLERYLQAYRAGGWEALKPRPKDAKGRSKLDAAVLQQAIRLRMERPARSVEQLIFLLVEGGLAAPGQVAPSTLARHLRRAGASRGQVMDASPSGTFRRFEASDILELLQSDFKHFVYLPDPKQPKKKRKTILLAILDDYSRYVLHAQIYWDEQLPRLEDSLKKAILKHGIPETFYCDNGSAFSAHHLARICGRLGIRLSHSRPYRPQGRGNEKAGVMRS